MYLDLKNNEESLKCLSDDVAWFSFQLWKLIQATVHKIDSKEWGWRQENLEETVLRW